MYPNGFRDKALEPIRLLSNYKRVLIVHHDDDDGLASAAILKRALENKFDTKQV